MVMTSRDLEDAVIVALREALATDADPYAEWLRSTARAVLAAIAEKRTQ